MNKKLLKIISLLVLFYASFSNAANIVVSQSSGSDLTGIGSLDMPYATISQAMVVAQDGDEIRLYNGTYREKVVFTKSNISLIAVEDDVYISGTDLVDQWTMVKEGLYKTYFPQKVFQVLNNSIPQVRARYPNQALDTNLFNFSSLAVSLDDSTLMGDFGQFEMNSLIGANAWLLVGDRWLAMTAEISQNSGGNINLKNISAPYKGEGIGYLSNSMEFLDAPGEWHWQNDTLYYLTEENKNPSMERIEVQTRKELINLNAKNGIIIDGIKGYSGIVQLGYSNKSHLKNSSFKYLNQYHYLETNSSFHRNKWTNISSPALGISIFGSGNIIENCDINWSAGDGITLYGNDNTVINSSISNANYLGTDAAPISIGGVGNKILKSEISNGGRGVITMLSAQEFEIRYNRIHHAGLLIWDVGVLYTYDTDAKGGDVSYNWISDAHSGNEGSWGAEGVYLDNHSRNYNVHHNVIWNIKSDGIRFNDPAIGNVAYNNTIFKTNGMTTFNNGQFPTFESSSNVFFNNYLDVSPLDRDWLELSNNLFDEIDYLLDRDNLNFSPKENSPLKDAGIQLQGKPISFEGLAPDIGAYEGSIGFWTVGRNATTLEELSSIKKRDDSPQFEKIGSLIHFNKEVLCDVYDARGQRLVSTRTQFLDLNLFNTGLYYLKINKESVLVFHL